MLLDKWLFDTSQDWKVYGKEFESFNLEAIADNTFRAHGLCISALGYYKKGVPHFIDITETDLSIEPMVDNRNKAVTNSKKKCVEEKEQIYD